jgi:hypothetical protein
MRQYGNVNIPQEAFIKALKMGAWYDSVASIYQKFIPHPFSTHDIKGSLVQDRVESDLEFFHD